MIEIKSGYKLTEIGVIPEDWEVKRLGEIVVSVSSGKSNTKTQGGSFPLYGSTGIIGWKNYHDYNGDKILIARVGANAGTVKRVSGKYCVSDNTLIANFSNGVNIEYSFFYLINYNLNKLIFGSGQPLITGGQLKSIIIKVPPLPEQKAIAQALSDVDSLITSLEKLISKKRDIKTATMQQLLTGKKRLPGFSTCGGDSANKTNNEIDDINNVGATRRVARTTGYKDTEIGRIPEDWEVKNLRDIGETLIGLTYTPNNVSKFGTLVLRSSNIQNNQLTYDNNVYVDMDLPERVIVKKGDILICVRNGSRQLIGKCAIIDKKASGYAFGAFMSIFRTQYSSFVFYQFQSNVIQKQIAEIMGATINQITNKDMAAFKIPFTKNLNEQKAIAQVLSDMDTEITQLEARLEKTKAIKQGMMQELLSGRIRLV